MASLSLPRVLHPRKTSLEIERENFEKSQIQALHKAINSHETPLKQKHVRSAIIGTFHTQGAKIFWAIAVTLPAMDDRIVAWKLCHVVHKILREGHPLCLEQSQVQRQWLQEIGKLWGHLREGYGKMIRLYTTLLVTKLEFHKRNPRFPGHLGVSQEELESICGADINSYFEMSVEMFDYLDNILDLQEAVFGSLNMARSNSMTSAGQCRLSPLVPCIQEASKLYDYCVKLLFRLHGALPPDTLAGHRTRFLKQFKALKQFYENISNLQYFRDLIAIPPLPDRPPDFLTADFSTYVTQEVTIPTPLPEVDDEPVIEGGLIDTSDAADNYPPNMVHLVVHQDVANERDFFRGQCDRMRSEFERILVNHKQQINSLQDRIADLETGLASKNSELMQERQIKEDLMNQAFSAVQSQDTEQKVKDEKFAKLKDLYVKLRTEHIDALRERGNFEKKLEVASRKANEFDQLKGELEEKLTTLRLDVTQKEDEFCKAQKMRDDELEKLRRDKDLFDMEREVLKTSVSDACKERDSIQLELSSVIEEKEQLRTLLDGSNSKLTEFDQIKLDFEEKLNKLQLEMNEKADEYSEKLKMKETELSSLNEEKEQLRTLLDGSNSKLTEYDQIKLDLDEKLNKLQLEMNEKVNEYSEKLQMKETELDTLRRDKDLFNMEAEILKKSVNDACAERDSIQLELNNVLQEKEELKKHLEGCNYKLLESERQLDNEQKAAELKLRQILNKAIENSKNIIKHAIHEVDNPALTALTCSPDYLHSLGRECSSVLAECLTGSTSDYSFVIVICNLLAHRHSIYIIQGRATGNTSPDITFAEKMAENCKLLGEIILRLLSNLETNEINKSIISDAKLKLEEIELLANNINVSLLSENSENLADLLETELMAMDKAIEEAANRIRDMMEKSRAADSGVKLEVNSKILDSCTNLMAAIRILVQKSRLLQAEIVAQGRGTASAKEFYKRNHQWTDGFISAAKAVAVAAQFLLTAADKVVSSNGKLEQLVVASQEISASTAQLVVASRVKADRNSNNLQQLTGASKQVTTATATVLATVKDCAQLMDEAEEFDVTNLSLHQAKRIQMDLQVRVLELEKELEQERFRLGALRKHHYQMAGDENET